ncbi:MAG: site-specific DNA-methyltransferase [Pseudomonadota bacterium]
MSTSTAGAVAPPLRPLPLDEILCGDATATLATLPDGQIDCIFADPPYNLQLDKTLLRPNHTKVAGVDAAWDRFDDFAAYDAFSRAWLTEARRVLKPNGTIFVIGSYHNIFRIGTALQDLKYWILNDLIWVKSNPMPNFRGRRFTNAHETLIWAVREAKRTDYTFNYRSLKTFNDDVQHRSDWTFPLCGGAERLRDETGQKAHPTQKPEALVRRALLAATRPGDIVLDPFFGTGTTGAVAKHLGRHFIGIEREPADAARAAKRIAAITPAADVEQDGFAPKPQKIPFGMLVEAGHVRPGERMWGGKDGPVATVRVDGSIRSGAHEGSIHKVGAAVRNLSACNGWTYWHVRDPAGALVPLDALRTAIRQAL